MNIKINMDTILKDPNPVLRAKSEPVSLPLSKEDKETLLAMLNYVKESQDDTTATELNLQPAVGIAAPQIGINKQMSAIYIVEYDKNDEPLVIEHALVNPKIIAHSQKKCALAYGEGCLSIKEEYKGYVPRYQRVKVRAYDLLKEDMVTFTATNYHAIVVQHEIDHLNGILFYDSINQDQPWDKQDLKIIE